jgi:putative tricarboxylic transport membrane protein
VGVILGAIPGLNGGIGIAVMLPFTYAMSPALGLLFLGGIYMGSSYGGAISAILINCPGTVQATCTAIEGNVMARNGRGKEALYYSVLASGVGGFVGVLALIFFTPALAKLSLKFGPPEMMLVALCGLTIVGSMSAGKVEKGIFAAFLGLFLRMIGVHATSGLSRYTFGIPLLVSGFDIIPAIIGLFAITEMFKQAVELSQPIATDAVIKLEKCGIGFAVKNMFARYGKTLGKASILGTVVGILPGTGGAIASFLAYGEAKRASKFPERYGKGEPEGLIASESANNAAVGGSLVPMLSLGIPGSSNSAIMFGALTIHGLIPGPRLFIENADIAYTFLFGMLLTVVFMVVIGSFGTPVFSLILKAKMKYIIPAVLACSLFGAFSARNSMTDVLFACLFGILGLIFSKFGIPSSPLLLGLILGEIVESNFVRTITIAKSQEVWVLRYIFTRPLSLFIVAVAAYIIYANAKDAIKAGFLKKENTPQ